MSSAEFVSLPLAEAPLDLPYTIYPGAVVLSVPKDFKIPGSTIDEIAADQWRIRQRSSKAGRILDISKR